MAISYSQSVDLRGNAADPVILELLFQNSTIKDSLVDFVDGIKANTIFTENKNTVTAQAWTTNPSPSGTITVADTLITPVKVEFHDVFDYDVLRSGRWGRSMQPGAWNIISDEFNKVVLNGIANNVSASIESDFWNGATAATQTAVAALTAGTGQTSVGAAEKTYVAAAPTRQFDGVVTRLIYNNAGVGKRYKVAGTTITVSNIATEYAKLYTAINPVLFGQASEQPFIYAPRSHRQLINLFNVNQTYRDTFVVQTDGRVFYLGTEIKFVPIAENQLIAALPSMIKWCTDAMEDLNMVQVDQMPKPRKDFYYDVVFMIFAHVVNQNFATLYVG